MEQKVTLYHGSSQVVQMPTYGMGKKNNDYGQSFYCTESLELAKEWACTSVVGGYANHYELETKELKVLNLADKHVLNWLAVLIANRTFELKSNLALEAREYLIKEFLIDTTSYDVVIGYRADDSYFAFATGFVNGTISLEQLSRAMVLGKLGTQIVLKSKQAFCNIAFLGYEEVTQSQYYINRLSRDREARNTYLKIRGEKSISESIYMLDILRKGWKENDICL
ncbi:MAG: DUF3990 domain-containing protein [Eubacteriales bacterium]